MKQSATIHMFTLFSVIKIFTVKLLQIYNTQKTSHSHVHCFFSLLLNTIMWFVFVFFLIEVFKSSKPFIIVFNVRLKYLLY